MKEFIEKLIKKIENTPTKCLDTYSISCPDVVTAVKNGIEYGCVSRQHEIIEVINQLTEEHNNDCCEWKGFDNSLDENSVNWVYETTCGKYIEENHTSSAFQHCPYCGKKIKIQQDSEKEITLDSNSSHCINLLDPIIEVYGHDKENFVNKLSEIVKVSVIEKDINFIRISVPYISGKKAEDFQMQYLNLINSLEGSLQIKKICE